MPTTRRGATRQMLLAFGTATLTPACVTQAVTPGAGLTPGARFHTPDEWAWLTRVSDLLIPDTHTPGAVAAGVPEYLDTLMQTWANPQTQREHRANLHALFAQLDHAGPFMDLRREAALQVLTRLDAAAFADRPADTDEDTPLQAQAHSAWRDIKYLVTRAYFVSEAGARQELDWQLVPGRWTPCVALDA